MSARSCQTDKNIVMCLSSGRCGTNLLALLLDLAEDTHAVHEPVPGFHAIIDTLSQQPDAALPFVRDVKIPAILARDEANYVETSHLFGKGFFDAFVESGVPFRVVMLHRDPRDVARSLHRVKAVPARSRKRAKFLLHPEQDGVMELPGWQDMSDYQLCFWYALEMERRKDVYKADCKKAGIEVAEISLDELGDFATLRKLAGQLGLNIPAEAREQHAQISAVKVNRKGRYLPKIMLVPAPRQEEAVWRALGSDGRVLHALLRKRYGWSGAYPGGANDIQARQKEGAHGRSQPA